jgi:hemerythrin
MAKVPNQQIAIFRDVAMLFLRRIKAKAPDSDSVESKLEYAVKKQDKKLKSAHEEYVDERADLEVDFAMTDKDSKKLLREPNGMYSMTQEQDKSLRKAVRALMNKEIDIQEHFVNPSELPESLSFKYLGNDGNEHTYNHYDVLSAFEGIVIKPKNDE